MNVNFNSNFGNKLPKLAKTDLPQPNFLQAKESYKNESGLWSLTELGKEKAEERYETFKQIVEHRGGTEYIEEQMAKKQKIINQIKNSGQTHKNETELSSEATQFNKKKLIG